MRTLTTLAICVAYLGTLSLSVLVNERFSRLPESFGAIVPTWIITPSNLSFVHRFFDSSPFSPSNRYLGLTQILTQENKYPIRQELSNVVVVDLQSGEFKTVAKTSAWDTQVGAQVQWGSSDKELIYNRVDIISKNGAMYYDVHGVVHDISSNSIRRLQCPIYHVNSLVGLAASPNILKIKYTQLGYGAQLPNVPSNRGAPSDDGLFVTDLETGKCSLVVSLQHLASLVGVDTENTPTYGFHAKWSSDGKLIMFVIRTLESPKHGSKRIKRQHLFVISYRKNTPPLHVISWSSRPPKCQQGNCQVDIVDGNHPNWIPNTHKISMNLQNPPKSPCPWSLVELDVDNMLEQYQAVRSKKGAAKPIWTDSFVYSRVFECSSGHPNYHKNKKFALLDAYSKEAYIFKDQSPDGLIPLRFVNLETKNETWLLKMNLRRKSSISSLSLFQMFSWRFQPSVTEELGDTFQAMQTSTTPEQGSFQGNSTTKSIFQIQIDSAVEDDFSIQEAVTRERNYWRCDMHPAWSRDFELVAFHGRVDGGYRQVLVSRIGPDPNIYT